MSMIAPAPVARLDIRLPAWAHELVDWNACYADDVSRMTLAILLAEENVRRGTGGPFGAAIFDTRTGEVVSIGVNCVVQAGNSALHAEVLAIMLAEERLGTYALGEVDDGALELVTSCAPCAMCLGAIHWSGIRRVVCGASREVALAIGFDEGPVFESSYEYLRERGVEFVEGVLAERSAGVLRQYAEQGGVIYNASS